ncbi:ArnT family glycosyltransferase [Marinicella sp. W31]|uniref:ArnT family glycosyltransferase n=1 Tax=Marinicella sp. W31 TaxID=3023713 RepID=UPI003758230D
MNTDNNKAWFLILYLLSVALQCWLMLRYPLFADEAFYWLEGQHLAWSYAEVPGWTPWLAWFSTFLPDGSFFVRLPHSLAAWLIPWAGIAISRRLLPQVSAWQTGLMLLSLPLLMLTGILAIPDIWLILISLLCILTTVLAIQTGNSRYFLWLGLCVAIGINIHIRFWLLLFVATIVTLFFFRHDKPFIRRCLSLTLPMALIGLVPVLLFNFDHEFPLLQFQLKDRHPWSFQIQHLIFFPLQILLITPLVFILMLRIMKTGFQHQQPLIRWALVIAVAHWLLYALLGFFADGLRFNLHWGLISYTLILTLTCVLHARSGWILLTALSGWLVSLAGGLLLMHWQQQPMAGSLLEKRITEHASGWQQLAKHTENLLQPGQTLIADQFITASQLAYALNKPKDIRVLPHPANNKHGRQQQIEIMGLHYTSDTTDGLVVIEQSALKLEQQAEYYQQMCALTGGLKLIGHMEIRGIKKYDFFNIEAGACDVPTLFYLDVKDDMVSGWVITDKETFDNLNLVVNVTEQPIANLQPMRLQETPFLRSLQPQRYNMLGFKIPRSNFDDNALFRLCINKKDKTIELSPVFF